MRAIILSVGTELITGQTIDTNAAWLAWQLTQSGVQIQRHVTVNDDERALADALAQAIDEAELVIATGGLGPTPDDLTRKAIAAAIDQPLEENAEALAQIEAFFSRWHRKLSPANRLQALIPRDCRVIPNPKGTAPGIAFSASGCRLFALPGVPGEMRAMFEASVAPNITAATGRRCTRSTILQCFGIGEAKIGEIIADLMTGDRNPRIGTTAADGVIGIRILATGNDQAEAQRLIDADAKVIRDRLTTAVFGEGGDTLEGAVANLLRERGLTIATAESCTGGLLAKRLTDIPGSTAYFLRGYVAYANEAKTDLLGVPTQLIERHGAVSEEVARAMAAGCRTAAATDVALSITGIAGPSGGDPPDRPVGLVYLGLATSEGVEVKRLLVGEHLDRAEIRDRSCKSALNLLRLHLQPAQ